MGKSSKFRSKTPAKEFPLRIASVSLSHFSPPSRMGRVSGYHWQKNSLKETAQQSLFPTVPAPAPKSRLRHIALFVEAVTELWWHLGAAPIQGAFCRLSS